MRGQFAMEYLLVVGFSLAIIIPIVVLLYQQYGESRTEVQIEHMTELAREITYQAEKIYYQGAPSRITIDAYYPEGIESANINVITQGGNDYYYLEFKIMNSPVTISIESQVPIQGVLETYPGPHKLVLQVNEEQISNPDDDYVEISEGS